MRHNQARNDLPLLGAAGTRLSFGRGAVVAVPARKLGQIVRIGPSARAAIMGFVAGAVFWHLVGFWTFIDRIVFPGPETEAKALVLQQTQNSAIETGSITRFESLTRPVGGAKTESGCTALIRVPSTGLTRDGSCTKLTHPLRETATSQRRDLPVKRVENDKSLIITDLPISAFPR